MTPEVEARFNRIETNLERMETDLSRLETSVERSQNQIDRLTEFQAVLMESQNATFKALQTLSDNVQKLINLRGPNGQPDS